MISDQPILQKEKRVLSEEALKKLAIARTKAIEARKANCAARREEKARAVLSPPTLAEPTPVSETHAPVEDTPISKPVPETVMPRKKPRRQKIVLYSDSDSDEEAIYIKTKRKKSVVHQAPSAPPPAASHSVPQPESPQRTDREPKHVQHEPPGIVIPHWMHF